MSGTGTRLVRRFTGFSSCGCRRMGDFEAVWANRLAAESELRAPALARRSRLHVDGGRGFPNPQLVGAQGMSGTGTRLVRRFTGFSSCGCRRVGSFEAVRANHLAAESELRAPALARRSRRHVGMAGRGFPNPQLARAQGMSGMGTRLVRRFTGSSSCGCRRWEISKRCGRTALLRSRNSALRRWRGDRGGMWMRGADFQIRSWFERRGCLARALDLFGGSRAFHPAGAGGGRFRSGVGEPPCCGVGTPRSGAGAENGTMREHPCG
jgi:hypothetical protein